MYCSQIMYGNTITFLGKPPPQCWPNLWVQQLAIARHAFWEVRLYHELYHALSVLNIHFMCMPIIWSCMLCVRICTSRNHLGFSSESPLAKGSIEVYRITEPYSSRSLLPHNIRRCRLIASDDIHAWKVHDAYSAAQLNTHVMHINTHKS